MTTAPSRDTPTKIVFNAYYRVHPDDRQKFVDAVVPHLSFAAESPGCLFYVFAADLLDPATIHLSEGWVDQESVDRFHASEPFRAALDAVRRSVRILDHQGQRYEVAAHGSSAPPGGIA